MNRHSFLWPVAVNRVQQVVNGIPNCFYWDPVAEGAPSFQPELRYTRANGDVMRCYIIIRIPTTPVPHIGTSRGPGGTWDIYQMTPRHIEHQNGTITQPKNLGAKVLHRLGQFIINHPDLNENAQGEKWAGNPMSFDEAHERYPAAANKYLKPQQPKAGGAEGETEPIPGSSVQLNPTVSGLDSVAGAAVDYRPTNQQMLDDDDIPDNLWPDYAP